MMAKRRLGKERKGVEAPGERRLRLIRENGRHIY